MRRAVWGAWRRLCAKRRRRTSVDRAARRACKARVTSPERGCPPMAPHGGLTGGMDTPGRILATRYRLLERIGAGGMATVWRARDLRLERDVAIKILRPQF